jgi:hypothetical protein
MPKESIRLVLLVGALISFGLATAGVPARINLVALGLFLWVLTLLVMGA